MRYPKLVATAALAATALVGGAAPALAAPKGLPEDNPNKNAIVVPVTCDGVNDDQPFLIWIPNANSFGRSAAGSVGHPLGVDVPIGVQKTERQGAAFDRAVPCVTPIGPIFVMPAGPG